MNSTRLPPLNALRAFEAVARHQNFRKAADELFVTPAAVTHHIKALEAQLGIQLFIRHNNRGIELTDAAKAAQPLLQKGFEHFARAMTELRRHSEVPRLTIATTPTFASRWLMPRLHRFLEQHPGIDVSFVGSKRANLSSSQGAKDAAQNDRQHADVDIHLSGAAPDEKRSTLLFEVEIMPMCNPRLLPKLETPDDLRHQALLHADGLRRNDEPSAWSRWLQQVGIDDIDGERGMYLDHSTLALKAAVDGLGVTLAMPTLAADELASKQLVVAFAIPLSLNSAYYVTLTDAEAPSREAQAFHDWVITEAESAL